MLIKTLTEVLFLSFPLAIDTMYFVYNVIFIYNYIQNSNRVYIISSTRYIKSTNKVLGTLLTKLVNENKTNGMNIYLIDVVLVLNVLASTHLVA
jgi:hypothetical protein